MGFNPLDVSLRQEKWITLGGSQPLLDSRYPTAEDVLLDNSVFDIETLPVRDPNCFVSANLHNNVQAWRGIMKNDSVTEKLVLSWLENGVDITHFFVHFKGNFKGLSYDCASPPKRYFVNSMICQKYRSFINEQLLEGVNNGSLRVWGKVGECIPPKLILPLVIEESKPRLCHDARFLNLWIKHFQFQLETLRDVHRMVEKDCWMVCFDEKSGYSHVKLHPNSDRKSVV